MTAARQERKSRRGTAFLMAIFAIAALSVGAPRAIRAATSEWLVANRYTGLAIDGFDPVAYFTDAQALVGRPELELQADGATWRFRNEGNRAAFAASAAVYRPRFGGYDPVILSRGAAAAGNPTVWLIARRRLYFFYDNDTRAAFAANPDGVIEAAERDWPKVRATLVRD